MLSAAQMLDELMGRDRNLAPTEKRREVHWEDPEVCKYFLCGFCPHELFVNTRADLGPCDKLHDEKLKTSYEKSARYERVGYEEEFLRFLQTLLSDVERRIRKGQARLSLNNTQGGMASGPQVAREEKIATLTEKINDLVQKAEELGCEGKVEDAQGMMKQCELLTEERSNLENTTTFSMPAVKEMEVCEVCGAFLVKGDAHNRLSEHLIGKQHMGYAQLRATIDSVQMQTQQQQQPAAPHPGFRGLMDEHTKDMQVCEICGALLVVGDAQQRVDEHLLGKQHMGYAQIRSYVETRREKTRKKLRGEDEEREARLNKEREDREKEREDREKEREERRKKREMEDKEREERKKQRRSRSRSKSRSHRRSRSRSRSRRNKRSRSRDRQRRSRSRDRDRRHRSRSGSRSRHIKRSRSQGRRSRSRNRSKDRRGSRERRGSSRDRKSRDRRSSRDRGRHSGDRRSSRDRGRDSSKRESTEEMKPKPEDNDNHIKGEDEAAMESSLGRDITEEQN